MYLYQKGDYESMRKYTWVCKRKILQWSLAYLFGADELWFVNFFYSMDGWVRVLRPFNSISVISRRWKGEHERLLAMKRRLGLGRISPPAGFNPRPREPKSGALTARPRGKLSFIQDSADKHILSKTSRSVSSIPWITPEIRRKIRRKNKTHAKAKKTGSSKLRSKFETLRREIKADLRKQHDLYMNNLVGDVKAKPSDFYRYVNSQKKDT